MTIFEDKKIQKFISSILIVMVLAPSLVVFSIPKKAEAGIPVIDAVGDALKYIGNVFAGTSAAANTTNTAISIKNVFKEITRQILMVVAKRALASMTKSTVNWINNGFHGSPLFLENPKSFFKDIDKFVVKDLIDSLGYNPQRFPFGKDFALNTIDTYKSRLEGNLEYSLSRVTNDPDLLYNYQNDFGTGGWDAYILNTQYPQNNYIGFQMLANNELARSVANKAGQVENLLQQGQGFLSPQTCPDNPAYNNAVNEFQRPTFKFIPPAGFVAPDPYDYSSIGDYEDGSANPEYKQALQEYDSRYAQMRASDYTAWAKTNICPGGLQNTTPGSVVAGQITRALGSTFAQGEFGAALGNSLSAIFDALLSKLLNKGLNALASTVNPQPVADNWDYFGNTLGSPSDNPNEPWDVGPDEEIILSKFKEDVSKGISNTGVELAMMDNNDPNNYGIAQFFSLTWPKIQELDYCLPGPDLGWEQRLQEEADRNGQKLMEKVNDTDGDTSYLASQTNRELKYAVDAFKDWITTKMLGSLPHAIVYIDAIKEVEGVDLQSKELTERRRSKAQAMARLQAIETSLATFTTQPAPNSQEEKDLITIRKQYNAIFSSISNEITIEDTKTDLEAAKDKFSNLQKLVAQCTQERIEKQWTIPADAWKTSPADTSILPNAVGRPYVAVFGGPGEWLGDYRFQNYVTDGREKEEFCQLPIAGGFIHETFNGMPMQEYRNLPMVNGRDVFNYKGGGFLNTGLFKKTHHVDIQISCNVVYFASPLDYKGSIPDTLNGNITYPNVNSQGGNTGITTPLGTCIPTAGGLPRRNVTEASCRGGLLGLGGGLWTPNPTTNTGTTTPTNPGTVTPPAGGGACGGEGQLPCS